MTFRIRHLLFAAVLHLLLFGMLAGGVQCSRKPQPPMIIEAVLYDPSREQVVEKKKSEDKRRELDRKREQEDKKRKADAEKKEKEDAVARQQQEDKRKAEELEKKKKAEAAERKKQEERDRQKKEQQEKREKQEQEKRDADLKAQLQREIEQENLRRQMDQEAQARRQSALNAAISTWAARVSNHIRRNWLRPGGSNEDFSCTVQVQLLPDGTVTTVRISKSCGNDVLNKSVEDAVYRASPLPRPDDPAAFVRDLSIEFKPK